MKKLVAIAPKKGKISGYLTNGKAYPIVEYFEKKENEVQDHFSFIDDDGDTCPYSVINRSVHLNGLNWTIKEVEEKKSLGCWQIMAIIAATALILNWGVFAFGGFSLFVFHLALAWTIWFIICLIKSKRPCAK